MQTFARIAGRVLGLAVLAACVLIGWALFQFAHDHRIDNVVSEWARSVYVTIQVMFRMDPMLTLILFPLGIVIVLVLTGLLIWIQRER